MTTALQPQMGMTPPHHNQYLFSDHYLENILPADPWWDEALGEAERFCDWLRQLYADERDQLLDYNEDQLEEHWFKPIFRELGHVVETRASVPGLDARVKHPDYVLFPDEAARQAAARLQNREAYAAEALAVRRELLTLAQANGLLAAMTAAGCRSPVERLDELV